MTPDLEMIRTIGRESRDKKLGCITGEFAYRTSCGVMQGKFGYSSAFKMMEFVRLLLPAEKSKAADLGSADGIITFLTAEFEFKSYGFEIRKGSVEIAREYQKRFNKQDKTIFVNGNWQSDSTYEEANIQFEDINFFYIYPGYGGLQKAYDMISSRSKPGTLLAVKQSSEDGRAVKPTNLVHIKKIDCKVAPINIYRKECIALPK